MSFFLCIKSDMIEADLNITMLITKIDEKEDLCMKKDIASYFPRCDRDMFLSMVKWSGMVRQAVRFRCLPISVLCDL